MSVYGGSARRALRATFTDMRFQFSTGWIEFLNNAFSLDVLIICICIQGTSILRDIGKKVSTVESSLMPMPKIRASILPKWQIGMKPIYPHCGR